MIIVTGGAGFIGSNLVKGLNERGCTDVLVVDDLTDGTKFRNIVDCEISDYLDKDDFLARVDVEPGTLTVVWHSVMRQYVPEAQWRRVEAELDRLAAASTSDAGFAHICFEPDQAGQYQLALRLGSAPHQVLAQAPAHGLPAMECLSSACRD